MPHAHRPANRRRTEPFPQGTCQIDAGPVLSYLPTNRVDITELLDIMPLPRRGAQKEGFMPSHDRLLQSRFTRRQALLTLAASAAAPALASSFPRPVAAQDAVTLTLVAYSTPREAYEAIIPLFQATPEGTGVQFETSFAGSGEQSRAVEGGLPADIVAFSLEPDITRLVKAGLVADDWNADEYKGMVTDSVVALAFRPGNPKGIASWDDLIKEGVEVITPNPLTSGGARWNILAAYGA